MKRNAKSSGSLGMCDPCMDLINFQPSVTQIAFALSRQCENTHTRNTSNNMLLFVFVAVLLLKVGLERVRNK